MDKKNYQKPSIREVVIEDCPLCENSPQDPGPGGSRESRDFGEEE